MQPRKKGNTYIFASVPSTQEKAWELAGTGAPSGTLVIAFTQTAGRGRQGSFWYSPKGGLWFSFLFFPVPTLDVGEITFAAAKSLRLALKSMAGLDARIKFPNDVYFGDKKLAGVILEVKENRAVLGVGLNVNCRSGSWPADVPAVSLKEVLNRRFSRAGILNEFLADFRKQARLKL